MKKLTLRLTEKAWREKRYDSLEKSMKKIHSVSIDNIPHELTLSRCLTVVLDVFGSQLREFKSLANIIHGFDNSLKMMPQLESLQLIKTETPGMKLVSLPQLKTLKLQNTEILERIADVPKLTTLEVSTIYDQEALVNFLMMLPALTSLEIIDTERLFRHELIACVPFKLTKFVLDEKQTYIPEEQTFKKFLTLHRDTLKHLSLKVRLNSNSYGFLFTNFLNLEYLELDVTFLPSEKSFYCCISSMDTVKKMKLHGKFAKHEIAKLFHSNFPALDELDMSSVQPSIWSSKFLKTISTMHKNLKDLKIPTIFKGTNQNLRFKKLKSLHIGHIFSSGFLLNFVYEHSDLVSLSLVDKYENGKLTAEDIEKLLKHLPNLHHIHYKARIGNIKKFYDSVGKDCYRKLETITFEVLPNPLSEIETEVLKLILPMEQKYRQARRFDSKIKSLYFRHSLNHVN